MLMENKTLLKSEETIKKKCAEHFNEFEDFWSTTFDKIIQEFMNADESCKIKKIDLKICSPQVNCIVDICISKLSWTQEYALEKVHIAFFSKVQFYTEILTKKFEVWISFTHLTYLVKISI